MTREERKLRLEALAGHLVMKYHVKSNSSSTHLCFNIKIEDVVHIVENYQDVLLESNLYVSKYSELGSISVSLTGFEVFIAGGTWFYVKKMEKSLFSSFETYIKMENASEIEVDISGESILSIQFSHPSIKHREMFSFRKD